MSTMVTSSPKDQLSSEMPGQYPHFPLTVSDSLCLCLIKQFHNYITYRAILHDDEAYPNPSIFNPDRFITPDGQLNKDVRDPAVAAFGFGRRVCPGKNLAKDSLWISIVSILASFTIEKAKDEDGNWITPAEDYEQGLVK